VGVVSLQFAETLLLLPLDGFCDKSLVGQLAQVILLLGILRNRNFKNTGSRRWGLFVSLIAFVKQKKFTDIIIVFYTQFVITLFALGIQNSPYSPLRESMFWTTQNP
jgi:hypothetical protein